VRAKGACRAPKVRHYRLNQHAFSLVSGQKRSFFAYTCLLDITRETCRFKISYPFLEEKADEDNPKIDVYSADCLVDTVRLNSSAG
jgi:hypothetical protein